MVSSLEAANSLFQPGITARFGFANKRVSAFLRLWLAASTSLIRGAQVASVPEARDVPARDHPLRFEDVRIRNARKTIPSPIARCLGFA